MSDHLEKVRRVKLKHQSEWLKREEVVGVGIGNITKDEIGIIISVTSDAQKLKVEFPESVEGIPVKIQKSGKFRAE